MKTLTNYLYNLSYQVLAFILPLLTTPYISRVLGAEGVGQYAYTNTVATYFITFGLMGLSVYGSREIARLEGNPEIQRDVFWEITGLKMLLLVLSLLAYCGYVDWMVWEARSLYWIHLVLFAANMIDVTWLFQGKAQFKLIATRNCIVKIAAVAMTFLLVHQKSDLGIYAAISCGSNLLGNAFLLKDKWFRTIYRWKMPRLARVALHFRRTIYFAIPVIAGVVYSSFGKVVIGGIVGDTQLGLFQSADNLVRTSLTVITSFTTVLLPKMAQMNANAPKEQVRNTNDRLLAAICMMACPIALGIMSVSGTLVPWFFGQGFEDVTILLQLEAPVLVLMSLETTWGNVFLLASGRERSVTIITCVMTTLNIAFNYVFVFWLGTKGAIFALFLTEGILAVIAGWLARQSYSIGRFLKSLIRYLVLSTIMGGVIFLAGQRLPKTIWATALLIGFGCVVYVVGLVLSRDSNLLYVLNQIFRKGSVNRE